LDDLDARIGRIDELLATAARPTAQEISLSEVRAFVDNQTQSLKELLSASPERVCKVSGDVDLFSLPEDVVQTNQVQHE